MASEKKQHVAVIGAGPAGLTCAYLLSKENVPVTVLEADPEYVGGISRTVHYKGFLFDIGGHRFFSKSAAVEALWTEILPHDFLERPRSSRIYYRGKFFSYPLKAFEALRKLGVGQSLLCVLSYLKARLFPVKDPKSFEDWVSNQFGRRLFNIFFKSYTEKVWGMSCKEISADWAAQRIKGLSLFSAVWNALFPQKQRQGGEAVIKTLIDHFRYPRKGPGMMWEACTAKVRAMGNAVHLGCTVEAVSWDAARFQWTIDYRNSQGSIQQLRCENLVSSMPLRTLALSLRSHLSSASLEAAQSLRYRDFLTVAIMLKDRGVFSDNWIYIHEPGVKVGRVQNFKSWSPELVPDPSQNCFGMEYFCFEGDGLWSSSDRELIALATRELATLGLARAEDILDGYVVRQPKAYPVYDDGYAERVELLRRELETQFPTLHLIGRNGMHKYNNQDHAMMTAMLTAGNILHGSRVSDPWKVNEDAQYHEARSTDGTESVDLRLVPTRKDFSKAI